MTEFNKRLLTFFLLGFPAIIAAFFGPAWVITAIFAIVLVGILFVEWPRLFKKDPMTGLLLAPFYPILPIILLILMNHDSLYRILIFFLFFCIIAFDTTAYLVGNIIGKHKIWPQISPKKTWEGFLGGMIAMYLGAMLFVHMFKEICEAKTPSLLIFVIILSTIALVGDFFESYLKRRAHLKDSSNLLPGHGGLLDRFDSILFAAYFFYIFKDDIIRLLGIC